MSNEQLRLLLILAGCFLMAQVVVWLGYGVYLYVKGLL